VGCQILDPGDTFMRKPTFTIVLAALLALSLLSFLPSGPHAAQEIENTGRPWRYNSAESRSELRKLGAEGWEAYAVTVDEKGKTTFWLKK
jgi:hypothetical protein